MSHRTEGEKWVRLLRAYCPVAENEAQQGEQVDKLAAYLGIQKIAFDHPARQILLDSFPASGKFRNVVLTGTAGHGKTSLCFELVRELTGSGANGRQDGVEELNVTTAAGPRRITLIYDVTAWRKKSNDRIAPANLSVLERMAESAFGTTDEFFVLAVNDGQMHELFRALPPETSSSLRHLERTLIELHAKGLSDSGDRLRLVNLSMIPSEEIMRLCLTAILDRPEWACLDAERQNPLFSESSSLSRNYRALNTANVRGRLLMLARIADAAGHHLPTRGVLCLLSNALLGHPDARDCVLRPGQESAEIAAGGNSHRAALHRTLFGDNLTANKRRKREIYRFLSMLHIGEETTNDLDELFIFGSRDPELAGAYGELIEPDPFVQRNPDFASMLKRYIRGDIAGEEEMKEFLSELARERRRIFLSASEEQLHTYSLWRTSVFHYAREYLEDLLKPLESGRSPNRVHLRKLASGLNRIWTGLLLADQANEVYLATGLDLTTSPVSDVYLSQIELDSDVPGMEVTRRETTSMPDVVLRANGREFRFALTLPRFEFLCRVADGAMPSSFSRESCADFMSLKQQCLRDLQLKRSTRSLHLLDVHADGAVQRFPIHLGGQ